MFTARRASIVLTATIAMVFAGGSSSLTAAGRSPAPVEDGEPAVSDACLHAEGGFCEVGVPAP
jgi:hypothetical protein